MPHSTAKRKPKPRRSVKRASVGTGGCTCCEGYPSGTVFFCEDGVLTPINFPNYDGFLVACGRVSPFPYWERADVGMDPALAQALANAIAPYLPPSPSA